MPSKCRSLPFHVVDVLQQELYLCPGTAAKSEWLIHACSAQNAAYYHAAAAA
jgi:hypothetical protein